MSDASKNRGKAIQILSGGVGEGWREARRLLCLGLLVACGGSGTTPSPSPQPVEPVEPVEPKKPAAKAPVPSLLAPVPAVPADIDWVIFGGGEDPFSNQISISQDLAMARDVLSPSPGLVLFASGQDAPVSVKPTGEVSPTDAVRAKVAGFFAGPDEGSLVYRPADLPVDGPAYPETTLEVLRGALASGAGEQPLDVYVAGHGAAGETPGGHHVALWGGWTLSVTDLAGVLDSTPTRRPMRLLLSSCFGGGFADMIFRDADAAGGTVRDQVDCGLFATSATDEAAGCDPDPVRANQESYALHFLQALAGSDREGNPLPMETLDLDANGQIDPLEARAYARLTSRSIDVPTSTSERWLRWHAEHRALKPVEDRDQVATQLRDEVVVLEGLSEELSLKTRGEVERALATAEAEHLDLLEQLDSAAAMADDAYFALRIALLERWPELDRPWLARWGTLIAQEGTAILDMMQRSELGARYVSEQASMEKAAAQLDRHHVRTVRLRRLAQAHRTLDLAAALHKVGGSDWEHFLALRRCEAAPLPR